MLLLGLLIITLSESLFYSYLTHSFVILQKNVFSSPNHNILSWLARTLSSSWSLNQKVARQQPATKVLLQQQMLTFLRVQCQIRVLVHQFRDHPSPFILDLLPFVCPSTPHTGLIKGRRFSEKDWYYLQAQTDIPFHYLKLIV